MWFIFQNIWSTDIFHKHTLCVKQSLSVTHYRHAEFVHAKGWSDGKGFCYHLGRPRTLMLGLSGVYKEKGVVDCRWFPILCPPSYWRTETIVLLNPGWPYDPLWLTERGWNDWISEAGTQEFCGFHSPCLACSLLEVRIQVRSVMTSHVLGTSTPPGSPSSRVVTRRPWGARHVSVTSWNFQLSRTLCLWAADASQCCPEQKDYSTYPCLNSWPTQLWSNKNSYFWAPVFWDSLLHSNR